MVGRLKCVCWSRGHSWNNQPVATGVTDPVIVLQMAFFGDGGLFEDFSENHEESRGE